MRRSILLYNLMICKGSFLCKAVSSCNNSLVNYFKWSRIGWSGKCVCVCVCETEESFVCFIHCFYHPEGHCQTHWGVERSQKLMWAIVIVLKKKKNWEKIWCLAGSLGVVFKKTQRLNNISAAREPHKMCSGGIKRMRLHLIFFEVALAIKCGSWW